MVNSIVGNDSSLMEALAGASLAIPEGSGEQEAPAPGDFLQMLVQAQDQPEERVKAALPKDGSKQVSQEMPAAEVQVAAQIAAGAGIAAAATRSDPNLKLKPDVAGDGRAAESGKS